MRIVPSPMPASPKRKPTVENMPPPIQGEKNGNAPRMIRRWGQGIPKNATAEKTTARIQKTIALEKQFLGRTGCVSEFLQSGQSKSSPALPSANPANHHINLPINLSDKHLRILLQQALSGHKGQMGLICLPSLRASSTTATSFPRRPPFPAMFLSRRYGERRSLSLHSGKLFPRFCNHNSGRDKNSCLSVLFPFRYPSF